MIDCAFSRVQSVIYPQPAARISWAVPHFVNAIFLFPAVERSLSLFAYPRADPLQSHSLHAAGKKAPRGRVSAHLRVAVEEKVQLMAAKQRQAPLAHDH